jgi:hypothetical protein
MAVIGCFILAGCENPTGDNENKTPPTPQSVRYVSTDSENNRYTLTITENIDGNRAAYTPRGGDSFVFTIELYSDENYTVSLTCSGTVQDSSGTTLNLQLSVNNAPLSITIENGSMTVISGTITSDDGQTEITVDETTTLDPVINQDLPCDIYVAGTEYDGTNTILCYWKNGQKVTFPSTGYVMINDFIVSGSDVYVLGSEMGNGTVSHCYWKNGVKVLLPNAASTKGMAISGSDVYVAGEIFNADDEWIACYWKNGILTTLTTHPSFVNAIAISGEDVYIAGCDERDHYITDDDYWIPTAKACYWKNGNVTTLTDGNNHAEAYAITISEGNVYVAGEIMTWDDVAKNVIYIPFYWNGTTRTDLTDGTQRIIMDTIIVSSSNVYVLGKEQEQSGSGNWKPAYWKNGNKVYLNRMDDYGAMHSNLMAISGSNVYVAGESMGVACYWKNGVKMPPLSLMESSATAIAVYGTDVYVSGRENDGTQSIACYWKNGTKVELSGNASTNAIYVVAKN